MWVTLTKSDGICNLCVLDVIFIPGKCKTYNVGLMVFNAMQFFFASLVLNSLVHIDDKSKVWPLH